MKISNEIAGVIYDILVNHCEASEYWRDQFHQYAVNEVKDLHQRGFTPEFRFQGNLGFGGKIYLERDKWRIDCYPENYTAKRMKIIEEVNRKLKELYDRQKSYDSQ